MNPSHSVALCVILVALACGVPSYAFSEQWLNKAPMILPRSYSFTSGRANLVGISTSSDFTASAVGNQIIVIGGCVTDQNCTGQDYCVCQSITKGADAYNPTTNQWTNVPDAPNPRYRHAAVVIGDDIYLLGGRDLDDRILTTVDIYHVSSKSWSSQPLTWANATSDLVAVAVGQKIYAIGGYNADYTAQASTWYVDLAAASPTWIDTNVAPMTIARGDACAASDGSKIYVFGGFNHENFCAPLAGIEVYTIQSNQWHSVTSPASVIPRGDSSCGFEGGYFIIAGGETTNSTTACSKYNVPTADVQGYYPANNTWVDPINLPEPLLRFSGASVGGEFYIMGGQQPIDLTLDVYPISDNTYSFDTDLNPPVAPSSASSIVLSASAVILVLSVLLL